MPSSVSLTKEKPSINVINLLMAFINFLINFDSTDGSGSCCMMVSHDVVVIMVIL